MQVFGIGTPDQVDRRDPKFVEKLSTYMVKVATCGAFLILLDPKLTLTGFGQTIVIGGASFSDELKGVVIMGLFLGGWTAVQKFWLDSSISQKEQAQSMSRIAEGVPALDATSSTVKVSTPDKVTVTTQPEEPKP
jgi:hypothetical protein